jgi:hypothetical protein
MLSINLRDAARRIAPRLSARLLASSVLGAMLLAKYQATAPGHDNNLITTLNPIPCS